MPSQIVIDRFLRSKHSHQYNMHAHEKLILFFLASYMGKKSICYPSVKSLALDCNLSIDSIKRGIKALETKELIKISRASGYNNRYAFNLSIINQPNGTQCSQPLDVNSTTPPMLTATTLSANSTSNNITNHIIEYTSLNPCEVETPPVCASESNQCAGINEIFKYWQEVMSHPKAKLDKHRQRAINQALKLGYSIADLKQAIDGCAKTPFNMGQNDRQQIYDDINLIFRDAERIERFMNNASDNPITKSYNSTDLMAGVI